MWKRVAGVLFSVILLLATVGPSAFAQSSIKNYPAGWEPIGATVTLSVTGTSSNVQLGWATLNPPAPLAPANAQVCNTGTVNASVLVGKSDVVATTANYVVLAGACPLMALNGAQYIAAISNPSGNTSLIISTGNGSASNGSSPGGGSAAAGMFVSGSNSTASAIQNLSTNAGTTSFYYSGPVTIGSATPATASSGEIGFSKISASGTAPSAGFAKIEWVAGTNSGSCKLISYAGTSTTPVTIVDNVGGGC